jgi:serpin B
MNKINMIENIILSPLSAYQVLGLTANGARKKTLSEMLFALGSKDLNELNNINTKILIESNKFSTVEIANAIMTKFTPEKTFLYTASRYNSTVETLRNLNQVNSWCNKKTHGKIKKILDYLDQRIVMILLNAVYFKGKWYNSFKKSSTQKMPFYNLNDKSKEIKVERMTITENFKYYEDSELQMVELPYKQDSMSAVIILPNKSLNINNFISKLQDEKLQNLLKKMNSQKVFLGLPKFELNFSSNLNILLRKLGMSMPFNKVTADFTGIKNRNDGNNIYIDEIIQKTFLKVDESGTEAAAVTIITSGIWGPLLRPRPEIKIYSMIIDRPFLFLIRNKNLPQNHEMIFISKIEKL